MTRRTFITAASLLPAALRGAASPQPSLLIREVDPFCSFALLKARYDAGGRPSQDAAGLALSWLLTGRDEFGERAVAAIRGGPLKPNARGAGNWVGVVNSSLAFDWLWLWRGFDAALKERTAGELLDAAEGALRRQDLVDASEAGYNNYTLRYLAVAAFALAATRSLPLASRTTEYRDRIARAFDNILDITQFVTPDGSYHESMDYMRITWAPLVLCAELARTSGNDDPARRYSVFRSTGETYLYKLMPDGTPSREGDNEYPVLDPYDTAVLGYAVHRFKDPYAAWILRQSGFIPRQWVLPVLEFLWNDPEVTPRDPSKASEHELPRQKYFAGVGHLVMRTGWDRDATWIEFDSGPYFAKHQHLDQNQFTIYHKGYLAIDSGADYTDTESPHYLNYYRRTVAHNSMLVYEPGEKFFWSENVLPAANDGGQRMDSSRFWNTIRSLEDWRQTEDIWDLARMRTVDYVPGSYHYALGDATRAYQPSKLTKFTRELLYDPRANVLFVFDHVHATRPDFRKVWLLHGVNEPAMQGDSFRFHEGGGELVVHALLPRGHVITPRGGPGQDFWTPGDENGGAWGSGENWPLDPPEGGPFPSDPRLHNMWTKFYDYDRMLPSNRQNVVPGAWRVEVSPAEFRENDVFLHVIEIGDRGMKASRVEALEGVNVAGALVAGGSVALFADAPAPLLSAEVTLPDVPRRRLILTSLEPEAVYEIHFSGPNIPSSPSAVPPGIPIGTVRARANGKGVLHVDLDHAGNERLRITRV